MKIFLMMLFFPLAQAATIPSLPECSPRIAADKSVTLDCILAEISLHETAREANKNWLGIGSYVAFMRFYVKNPDLFSKLVIYKTVVGAVEECSVRHLFNFSTVLLIMQSPSPNPGGNYLKGIFGECLKTLLSEDLLDALFDDMDFLTTKKSFSRRTPLN
jgi:hypothetical protein